MSAVCPRQAVGAEWLRARHPRRAVQRTDSGRWYGRGPDLESHGEESAHRPRTVRATATRRLRGEREGVGPGRRFG